MQSLLLLAQRQAWEPLIEELAALQRDTFALFIAELTPGLLCRKKNRFLSPEYLRNGHSVATAWQAGFLHEI